jgi:uncharacterized membrane protein required for colicin V production
MLGSILLDLVIVGVLVGYLVYGYRIGLVRSLGGIVGVVVGAFSTILLVPLVTNWVSDPTLRTAAILAVVAALVVGGYSAGAAIGSAIQRRMKGGGLRRVDRALGAVLTTIVAALVVSALATSIAALGVPGLSQAISSSAVLRGITAITPVPVQSFLAQVRSATVDQSLPRIAQAFGGSNSNQIPNVNTNTAVLNRASQSVVRITGNAYACGQSQSGSGFVVTNERVITNAHVIAGVAHPVVAPPCKRRSCTSTRSATSLSSRYPDSTFDRYRSAPLSRREHTPYPTVTRSAGRSSRSQSAFNRSAPSTFKTSTAPEIRRARSTASLQTSRKATQAAQC